ncbi:hypothetical protein PGT21_015651 [Puccinia graminis f. sp. tritici]|nr:hypothetical protein, variant [Puccinia graminis f. sp. tritici CRL 75-36-700-3]EHS64198.1 hypothetical protein, variant [Puccinia graminis f. sp. tritici CRL 75-36-700-3]KAA1116486.1 hypothetical protein PGT21_015651 [Puccinia graminis f. sp. tritici]
MSVNNSQGEEELHLSNSQSTDAHPHLTSAFTDSQPKTESSTTSSSSPRPEPLHQHTNDPDPSNPHPLASDPNEGPKPAAQGTHSSESPEPDQEPKIDYIITLKQDTTKEQYELYKQQLIDQGAQIKHEYFSIILKGYAVSLKPSKLQSFQQDPLVKDVEMDQKVHI